MTRKEKIPTMGIGDESDLELRVRLFCVQVISRRHNNFDSTVKLTRCYACFKVDSACERVSCSVQSSVFFLAFLF